jgi:hypothetical protein
MLAALGVFDLLRIDAADSGRRNRVSAFCADRIERGLNFFQVDFQLPHNFADYCRHSATYQLLSLGLQLGEEFGDDSLCKHVNSHLKRARNGGLEFVHSS